VYRLGCSGANTAYRLGGWFQVFSFGFRGEVKAGGVQLRVKGLRVLNADKVLS